MVEKSHQITPEDYRSSRSEIEVHLPVQEVEGLRVVFERQGRVGRAQLQSSRNRRLLVKRLQEVILCF